MKILKTLLTLLLLSTSTVKAADQLYSIDQDNSGFGGGIDYISIDKAASKYAPIDSVINVRTDDGSEITKKRGSVLYNDTPTVGSAKHRRAYTYNKANGLSYIIVQTSNSLVYSKSDTNFTTFITTLSADADCDFTTAKDSLFYTDGTHNPGSWDGTSVTNYTVNNSTYYPQNCKYISNWYSRNWMAGDSTYRNRVYFTQAYAPGVTDNAYTSYADAALNPLFIDLGVNDGDYITGMFVWKGRLLIFFTHKIFEIVQINTGVFGYNLLSENIGCLYNTSIDILNDFPIFVSHRGVEQFDGSKFNLVSLPIDNYVKNLNQLKTSQGILIQTSFDDFNNGTTLNISTQSISGSIVLASIKNDNTITSNPSLNLPMIRQKFVPSNNITVSYAGFKYKDPVYGLRSVYIDASIRDSAFSILVSTRFYFNTTLTLSNTFFNFSPVNLIKNSTYYLVISSSNKVGSDPDGPIQMGLTAINQYNGETFSGATWNAFGSSLFFYLLPSSGSFSSEILNASSWGSWGVFNADDIVNSESSITYYVKTSTASDNFNSKSLITVNKGQVVNSVIGNYIQIIASFTSTLSNISLPTINEMSINYYGTDNNVPYGKVWEDSYYLAVNTGTTNTGNGTVLILQKNGDWVPYNNTVGCFLVYRDYLYYGDSQDNGNFYRMEVPNVFTDNGNNYSSYWTSKKIAINPIYKNQFKELWITCAGVSNTLDLEYNFDDYIGTWQNTSLSIPTTYGISVNKINLLPSCYSRYFQFKIGNSTNQNFKIKRLDLLYNDVPSVE